MVRDAKLDQVFEIKETPGATRLSVRHRSRGRYFLAVLIGLPATLILLVITAIALFTGHMDAFVPLALATIVAGVLIYLLAGRRRTTNLDFDADGVIRGKTRYRYQDIAEYGTHHLDAGKVVDGKSARAAAMEIGNALYIDFGAKRINLVEGLKDGEATQVFSAFDRLYQSHSRD